MSVDVSGLPDNPQVLKQILLDIVSEHEKNIKDLENKLALMFEEVDYWRNKVFGRKSEKYNEKDPIMEQLFNETEMTELEKELEKNKTTEKIVLVPIRRREKQGGRTPLPPNLPRKDTVIEINEENRICPCNGKPMRKIDEEVAEKLHVEPMKVWVERIVRHKYACEICEGTATEDEGGAVRIAPLPVSLFPKSYATPSLIAYISTSKFCDSLPFYRLSRMMGRMDIRIPRQTMCRWMIELSVLLRPLLDLLKKYLLMSACIGSDESRFQVLKELEKAAESLSYMWAFRGGTKENPIVIYEYRETHSGSFLPEYLAGYKGYVQTDDFSSYNILETIAGIILVGCWAHSRRRFFDAAEASKTAGNAQVGLTMIRKLYAIEDEARKGKYSDDQTKELRQQKALPVLHEIKSWLDEKVKQVPPAGLLGKAIHYALNNWEKLIRYTDAGFIPIDNNGVENIIRLFAVGRKNWLFADTPAGAHASAAIYTFYQNAMLNGFDPYWYGRFVFEKLPYAKTEEDYKALLPQFLNKEEFTAFRYRDWSQ